MTIFNEKQSSSIWNHLDKAKDFITVGCEMLCDRNNWHDNSDVIGNSN